jgi:ATP-binding cassette subfamily B protein
MVFDNLNLKIAPYQKVGIVGVTGAGKTTLINLLLKYFTVLNGSIMVDNNNIFDVSDDSLRRNIAVIPQDILLFHDNILENVRCGNVLASDQEVFNVCKKAEIHDDIMKMPLQYNTIVGERGIKLSGGQRQRIAIARAILKNAPILILDEATSALDSETEQKIQKSINNMLDQNNATVIAIAHRLSTIKHLDRIIVMNDGKIVEDGSFNELIEKNGVFKNLWDMHMNGMII